MNRFIGDALRSLPHESPPPFDWAELRRRAREQGRLRSRPRLAIAASLGVLIVSAALLAYWRDRPEAPSPMAARSGHSAASSVVSPQIEASRRWLASLPDDRAIVRVSSRVAVVELQDRLALVDDTLNAARISGLRPARLHALQNERAQLLQSLVQVRYAETLAAESP